MDPTGKRTIVTGGASGIGIAATTALARRGATITLAVRNTEVGRNVAQRVSAATGNENIDVRELTDPESTRRFVHDWNEPLHVLINNAGVMAIQAKILSQVWEAQFASNHLQQR